MSDLVSSPRVNSQPLPAARAVIWRDGWLAVIGWVGILLLGVGWFNQMLFGDAAKSLPYIECLPQRPSAPQAVKCESVGITQYPTWVFAKQQYAGVLSLAELARLSRYKAL